MNEIIVNSFYDLHEFLSGLRSDKRWVFRGHSDPSWKLLPKAGRAPFVGIDEKSVFEAWKRAAIEHVKIKPESDWEWLAIAQHHGLATRLLDWTSNPLNACYFATYGSSSTDVVVYAAYFEKTVIDDKSIIKDPFELKRLALFRPQRVVPRITRQGGLFSISSDPNSAIEADTQGILGLKKIIIAHDYKDTLLSELSYYGINSASLFPDLDGISNFLNWTIESREYWNYS